MIVVEDGSVVENANSYASTETADTYHSLRGNAAWAEAVASPDEDRESALIRATTWIDATFRSRWPGKRTSGRSQELDWPRQDAVDQEGEEIADDEIPGEVVDAVCEAALRELASPGSLSPDYVASERVKQEQVGPLSVTYMDPQSAGSTDVRPVVSIVEDILSSLVERPSGTQVSTPARF